MKNKLKQFFGNKQFYKMCLLIMLPIIIQQGISAVAVYIDNTMVNRFSTEAFIGVSTVNKLTFICMFLAVGVSAGIGMFLAQFLGAKNKKQINATIQLSLLLSLFWGIVISLVIYFGSSLIVRIFLPLKNNDESVILAQQYGIQYGKILGCFGILIMLQIQISTCFRSLKKTFLPMVAGVIGVIVNVCLNYLLIYGVGYIQPLGVKGAAIATVIAKAIEIIILICYLIVNKKYHYIFKVFIKRYISIRLIKNYFKKGTPSFIDELSWAIGLIVIAKFITIGNPQYVQSYNYAINITDLFFVVIGALGGASAVIIGEQLGKSNFEKAKIYAKQLKGLAFIVVTIVIVIMITLSPALLLIFVPKGKIYNDAYFMIIITALFLLVYAYNHMSFYILTAGGDTIRSFLLDFYPTFFIAIPALILLGSFAEKLSISVVYLFLFNKAFEASKSYFYYYAVKDGKWIRNIVKDIH